MTRPKNIIDTGQYVEPNTFESDSEAALFYAYLELWNYVRELESSNEREESKP